MEPFGKYVLLRRLAYGGMAEIFLARLEGEEGFRKTCVLKRILPQFSSDTEFVRMFVDEAVLAARLTHPNVVQTYDFGNIDGSYFIAMELIDGTDLRNLSQTMLKKARFFSPAEVAALGEEICRGLSYVHNLRDEDGAHLSIVHRDISPHNIMLSRAGQAKIMDFGIAKAAMRAVKTRTGTIKGKLAYMAPEQASAHPVDKRTDQFAVGLVLWELVTGVRHFEGASEPELLGQVMRCDIRDPRELRPDVPEPLVAVIERMLQKAPGDRFPDLSDAEQALHSFRFSLGTEGAVRLSDLAESLAPPMDLRPDGSVSGLVKNAPAGSGSQRSGTKALPSPNQPPAEGGDAGWQEGGAAEPTQITETLQAPSSPTIDAPSSGTLLLEDPLSSPSVEVAESLPAAKSPRRSRWGVAAGVGAVLLAAVVAVPFMGGSARDEPGDDPSLAQVTPVASPATGRVVLDSEPSGAQIFLDGKDTGLRTPNTFPKLEFGTTLALELRLEGFEPAHRSVSVSQAEHRVRVELAPVRAEETLAQVSDEPAVPEPEPTMRRAAKNVDGRRATHLGRRAKARRGKARAAESESAPEPPTQTGRVSIRTEGPWVEVFFKGKQVGNTPFNNYEVPAGKAIFKLRRPGESAFFETVTVNVPPDGHVGKTVVSK